LKKLKYYVKSLLVDI